MASLSRPESRETPKNRHRIESVESSSHSPKKDDPERPDFLTRPWSVALVLAGGAARGAMKSV